MTTKIIMCPLCQGDHQEIEEEEIVYGEWKHYTFICKGQHVSADVKIMNLPDKPS